MNGYEFLQKWHWNENFFVEIKTVQSHRYSSEVYYYNVKPDIFKFYVRRIERISDNDFSITGYLHHQLTDNEMQFYSKVMKKWVYSKNLLVHGNHCKIQILDVDENPFEDLIAMHRHLECPNTFVKVGNKSHLHYGDGGECITDYQLYVAKKVSIENSKEIVKFLVKLGKYRNDWNPNAPVLDIIDPDLYPAFYQKDEWIQNRLDIMADEDANIARIIRREIRAVSPASLMLNDPAHERYKYHWQPINVTIDGDFENVKFLTTIPGLPKNDETESFYKNITEVFKKMLPGFEELGIVKRRVESKLQVILKAQLYRIDPGTTYTGKWHTEGVTERIVAVGVYYAFTHRFLNGGNLEFSLKNYPNEYYSTLQFKKDYESIGKFSDALQDSPFVEEVDVSTDTAIVFSNDLPHRFKKIINETDTKGYRVFINFFVVDPKHPLPLEDEPCPLNEQQILEQRERIRKVLLQAQKGWGHIHYGNVGEVGYVDKTLFGQPIIHFRDINTFVD